MVNRLAKFFIKMIGILYEIPCICGVDHFALSPSAKNNFIIIEGSK